MNIERNLQKEEFLVNLVRDSAVNVGSNISRNYEKEPLEETWEKPWKNSKTEEFNKRNS